MPLGPYNRQKGECTEKSTTLLGLVAEGRTQGTLLPPRLERQMGEDKESLLTVEGTRAGYKNLNYN